MQALYGIASRDPLADRVLLETALRQPEWWRRHDGVSRAVCRAAMRDVLPAEIVDRTTGGAQLPDWLDRLTDRRSEVAEELQQLRDHAPSRNVIDVEKLDRLMQAWPDLSQAADPKVIADYQSGFSRALLVSKYARWFESRARRVAAGGPAVVVSQP
jgi:asparagine synthase (glutamine-hydrolysing)